MASTARTTVRLKWTPRPVQRRTEAAVRQGMEAATIFLRDQVKLKLNRGQATRTTAGGNIIGLNPSKPGEPPKKVTGIYQNSIRSRVVRTSVEIIGLVGTDQKRAPALELGSSRMAARPHFRPALRENRGQLIAIVTKGSISA